MPRDARAYLSDVIEACDAITNAVRGLDLRSYESNRLVRSSVEREFIIIGEALGAFHRLSEEIFGSITRARRIVDFRNPLMHQYLEVRDNCGLLISAFGVIFYAFNHQFSPIREALVGCCEQDFLEPTDYCYECSSR